MDGPLWLRQFHTLAPATSTHSTAVNSRSRARALPDLDSLLAQVEAEQFAIETDVPLRLPATWTNGTRPAESSSAAPEEAEDERPTIESIDLHNSTSPLNGNSSLPSRPQSAPAPAPMSDLDERNADQPDTAEENQDFPAEDTSDNHALASLWSPASSGILDESDGMDAPGHDDVVAELEPVAPEQDPTAAESAQPLSSVTDPDVQSHEDVALEETPHEETPALHEEALPSHEDVSNREMSREQAPAPKTVPAGFRLARLNSASAEEAVKAAREVTQREAATGIVPGKPFFAAGKPTEAKRSSASASDSPRRATRGPKSPEPNRRVSNSKADNHSTPSSARPTYKDPKASRRSRSPPRRSSTSGKSQGTETSKRNRPRSRSPTRSPVGHDRRPAAARSLSGTRDTRPSPRSSDTEGRGAPARSQPGAHGMESHPPREGRVAGFSLRHLDQPATAAKGENGLSPASGGSTGRSLRSDATPLDGGQVLSPADTRAPLDLVTTPPQKTTPLTTPPPKGAAAKTGKPPAAAPLPSSTKRSAEVAKGTQPRSKRPAPAAGSAAAASATERAAGESSAVNGRMPDVSPDLDSLHNVPPPPPKLSATQRLLNEGKQLKYEWDKCEDGPDKVRTGLQAIFAYMRAIHKTDDGTERYDARKQRQLCRDVSGLCHTLQKQSESDAAAQVVEHRVLVNRCCAILHMLLFRLGDARRSSKACSDFAKEHPLSSVGDTVTVPGNVYQHMHVVIALVADFFTAKHFWNASLNLLEETAATFRQRLEGGMPNQVEASATQLWDSINTMESALKLAV